MTKVKQTSKFTYNFKELTLELPQADPDGDNEIEYSAQLENGIIVLGYKLRDPDAENPLEYCDAMGSIYSFSRRHGKFLHPEQIDSEIDEDKKPYIVPLSYFEHGQCIWGVAGTLTNTPDFRWDGVGYAGIWVPDKCCLTHIQGSDPSEDKRKLEAIECAKQACEEYTSWCNGECYGIIIAWYDAEGDLLNTDACWGYIGWKYADTQLKEDFESKVSCLREEMTVSEFII